MKKIDFKPYIQIYLDEENSNVKINRPFKDQNKFYVYKLNEVGLFIFKTIDGMKSFSQITEMTLEKFPDAKNEIDSIFKLLVKENYIEEIEENVSEEYKKLNNEFGRLIPIWSQYETKELDRYKIQQLIIKKRVGIIGCGTIGFSTISDLIASGVEKFVLFDSDVVELSNLSRQPLFEISDIGKNKVDVVKKFIKNRRVNGEVIVGKSLIETEEDLEILKNVDIILVSADFPSYEKLSRLVQNFALKNNIAVSFAGGYRANQGRIYPLYIPNKSYCFNCLADYLNSNVQKLGKRLKNRNIVISSNSQMSKFISSVVSSEMLKYLSGVIEPYNINQYMSINFLNYEIEKHPFDYNNDCSYCNSLKRGLKK